MEFLICALLIVAVGIWVELSRIRRALEAAAEVTPAVPAAPSLPVHSENEDLELGPQPSRWSDADIMACVEADLPRRVWSMR
ncbi:MAG: hypothetical protein ABSG53_08270 [Thermoguttaceae bacterium]|jgi:hypothetical protein